MPQIKPGDVVQLLSGGPKMTVQNVDGSTFIFISCQWFAGSKLEEGRFPSQSLKVIVEEPIKKE
jgi:uncharacterized protein YodC (DUF2158 family)